MNSEQIVLVINSVLSAHAPLLDLRFRWPALGLPPRVPLAFVYESISALLRFATGQVEEPSLWRLRCSLERLLATRDEKRRAAIFYTLNIAAAQHITAARVLRLPGALDLLLSLIHI